MTIFRDRSLKFRNWKISKMFWTKPQSKNERFDERINASIDWLKLSKWSKPTCFGVCLWSVFNWQSQLDICFGISLWLYSKYKHRLVHFFFFESQPKKLTRLIRYPLLIHSIDYIQYNQLLFIHYTDILQNTQCLPRTLLRAERHLHHWHKVLLPVLWKELLVIIAIIIIITAATTQTIILLTTVSLEGTKIKRYIWIRLLNPSQMPRRDYHRRNP